MYYSIELNFYAHALVELNKPSNISSISVSVSSYESMGLLLVGCLQGCSFDGAAFLFFDFLLSC